MKKGFTLIELLAVIVILAILALIVSPIISGVITNAKSSASERSLEGYVSAIELAEIKYQTEHAGSISKSLDDLFIEAKSKNKVTIYRYEILDSGLISSINARVDGYYCLYEMENGAKCSLNEEDLYPNYLLNPFDDHNKGVIKILEKYNISNKCYYNYFCNTSEISNRSNAITEINSLNYIFYKIINPLNIKSITFYADGRVIDDSEVIDVSSKQDNSIKLYYKEIDGMYEISISSNTKIYFPPNCTNFFLNVGEIDFINFNNSIDTTLVYNMSSMFNSTGYNGSVFNLDLSNFDTSNVFNMSNMFNSTGYNGSAFNLELGDNFDTSKVTDMSNMFNSIGYNDNTFTLDLKNKFDTSNVTNMSSMFESTCLNCRGFTLKLRNKFDTSKVTNMANMFSNTGYSSVAFSLNLGDKFDTSKVTDMSNMFSYAGYGSSVFLLKLGNMFKNIAQINTNMFNNTGKSNSEIYVPNDIYYSDKQLKLNSTSNIYTESLLENRKFVRQ